MPEKGEPLALGDIAETNSDPRVQKAMRRLAEDMAPSRVSQLVMWHLVRRTRLGHASPSSRTNG